jgi:hypothetical protein
VANRCRVKPRLECGRERSVTRATAQGERVDTGQIRGWREALECQLQMLTGREDVHPVPLFDIAALRDRNVHVTNQSEEGRIAEAVAERDLPDRRSAVTSMRTPGTLIPLNITEPVTVNVPGATITLIERVSTRPCASPESVVIRSVPASIGGQGTAVTTPLSLTLAIPRGGRIFQDVAAVTSDDVPSESVAIMENWADSPGASSSRPTMFRPVMVGGGLEVPLVPVGPGCGLRQPNSMAAAVALILRSRRDVRLTYG